MQHADARAATVAARAVAGFRAGRAGAEPARLAAVAVAGVALRFPPPAGCACLADVARDSPSLDTRAEAARPSDITRESLGKDPNSIRRGGLAWALAWAFA